MSELIKLKKENQFWDTSCIMHYKTKLSTVLSKTPEIVYSTVSLKGTYTFPAKNGMYLAIYHVNGSDLCTFDVINIQNNNLYKTNIKTSSSYLTVTYTNFEMKFVGEYTVTARIVKL